MQHLINKTKEISSNHSRLNDELANLLAKCQIGDKQAFSLLYQTTASRLNGIAYRITRNVDTANEVLQEAFIQIWKNSEQYQLHKSEPFTWLASIVRYRAYDRLRYDKNRAHNNMVEFDENDIFEEHFNEINHYTQLLAVNEDKALNNCLSLLEKKQSQSILMAYIYGYSREDISNYFDKPVNTIKSWIRRGLGKLKLCLSN